MNNGIPFFYPPNQNNFNNLDKIYEKLERLEKDLRILNNRINKLENKKEVNPYPTFDPKDMHMI